LKNRPVFCNFIASPNTHAMQRTSLLIAVLLVVCHSLNSQVYMDLQDNIDVESNSWIIFNPGDYTLSDDGQDGLIRINNKENIILEGPGVTVDGTNFNGYMVKISNSENIIIRNWDSVRHFKYAVHILTADSVTIHDCNFSYNKVDSAGWINIWTNYPQALGGGVMMYQVNHGDIHNNVMKMQNDGVALYHCNNIQVWENDFDWNTSFGIRMYFTDSCHIHHNQSSHINRPYTNPSDCAAILLIVSNSNLVEHNNFSHSGDGIFLGQYEYSGIPNNNVFLYNECSYSPHNAIEATFADGNVYKHNICNYSHYGFWLGYSFNSLVDSNEIAGNQHSGIAIDRGFENTILNNEILNNPMGIKLWEGGNIPGYENQFSHDYLIEGNVFDGNRLAVYADNTEHLVMLNNEVNYNNNGIQLLNDVSYDTIANNNFKFNTFYHIDNQSPSDVYAPDNTFFALDDADIDCNLFDNEDDVSKGEIMWEPYSISGSPVLSGELKDDLAEEPALWYAYPEVCGWWDSAYATHVAFDSSDFVVGASSVFCGTGNGWDIGLEYHAAGDTLASWSLSPQDTMIFWVKTNNLSPNQFQYHSIRLGNYCGGYYSYSGSASYLSNAQGIWKKFVIPLAGGGTPYYVRTQIGDISLEEINYFSLHADTWDVGFELWLDGLHFSPFSTGQQENDKETFSPSIIPNPTESKSMLTWYAEKPEYTFIRITGLTGVSVRQVWSGRSNIGKNTLQVSVSGYTEGAYLIHISSPTHHQVCKLIIIR
jgi:parallel beta-helix repeat protein